MSQNRSSIQTRASLYAEGSFGPSPDLVRPCTVEHLPPRIGGIVLRSRIGEELAVEVEAARLTGGHRRADHLFCVRAWKVDPQPFTVGHDEVAVGVAEVHGEQVRLLLAHPSGRPGDLIQERHGEGLAELSAEAVERNVLSGCALDDTDGIRGVLRSRGTAGSSSTRDRDSQRPEEEAGRSSLHCTPYTKRRPAVPGPAAPAQSHP